jgi:hypothetical protein
VATAERDERVLDDVDEAQLVSWCDQASRLRDEVM